MTQPNTGPLVSTRSAVVLLIAVLVGLAVTGLTLLMNQPWPAAVIAGGTAAGASIAIFNSIIG